MRIEQTYWCQLGALALWLVAVCLPVIVSASTGDQRLDEATRAVENAEFDALVPILEPLVDDPDTNPPPKARLLFALGLVYEAPEEAGEEYFDTVDDHIGAALTEDPDLDVDPLLYPPSFVARVQDIRATINDDVPGSSAEFHPEPNVFYFERRVKTRSRLPLFLPGGIGQFHNDAHFRGITFATIQLAGLAANIVAHWRIESMRTSTGYIPADEMNRAGEWRTLQYAGLATIAAGWLVSVLEANLGFESRNVRIRTLDDPPDELEEFSGEPAERELKLGLQWSASF